MWDVGSKLGFFVRGQISLNHWAITPFPRMVSKTVKNSYNYCILSIILDTLPWLSSLTFWNYPLFPCVSVILLLFGIALFCTGSGFEQLVSSQGLSSWFPVAMVGNVAETLDIESCWRKWVTESRYWVLMVPASLLSNEKPLLLLGISLIIANIPQNCKPGKKSSFPKMLLLRCFVRAYRKLLTKVWLS